MSQASRVALIVAVAAIVAFGAAVEAAAQVLPNPYRQVDGWAKLPAGRSMGAVGGVTTDDDASHIWAVIRCDATAPDRFGNECLDSDLDPVVQFDLEGNVVTSFGAGSSSGRTGSTLTRRATSGSPMRSPRRARRRGRAGTR